LRQVVLTCGGEQEDEDAGLGQKGGERESRSAGGGVLVERGEQVWNRACLALTSLSLLGSPGLCRLKKITLEEECWRQG